MGTFNREQENKVAGIAPYKPDSRYGFKAEYSATDSEGLMFKRTDEWYRLNGAGLVALERIHNEPGNGALELGQARVDAA